MTTNLQAGGTNTRGDTNSQVDYLLKVEGQRILNDSMAEIASRLVIELDTGDDGTLTLRVAGIESNLATEVAARKTTTNELESRTKALENSPISDELKALEIRVNDLTNRISDAEETIREEHP